MSQTDAVAAAFRAAVRSRKMGNFQLRQRIKELPVHEAEAALRGAKEGGLRITADSHEIVLNKLLETGAVEKLLLHYQLMLKEKTIPNTTTYNLLLKMCCEKDLADSALRLFDDMRKRGRQPDVHTYELAMLALSKTKPVQWERAVEIFDKLAANRPEKITEKTYSALMTVYLNMDDFEWRIVYNCFYEMRNRKPKIIFTWGTYDILAQAMRKGRAGYFRRISVYVDTWIQVTPLWSTSFWKGIFLFVAMVTTLKYVLGEIATYFWSRSKPEKDIMRSIHQAAKPLN